MEVRGAWPVPVGVSRDVGDYDKLMFSHMNKVSPNSSQAT